MAGVDIQLRCSCIRDLLYIIKIRATVKENSIEIQNCLNFTQKNDMLSCENIFAGIAWVDI